jgi:asparagine synthetase B (glutamine-hydrolysing)
MLHLASDVPLAFFLSSGVDSSVMANLAQSPIHTFTLAFEEKELNEGPAAKRIAAAIGTQHHEVVLTEGRFVENLEAALDSLDQPTFDGLNAYYMSHAIRNAGFTVALSGTGGDELFGGYTSYRDLPVLQRWSSRHGNQVNAAPSNMTSCCVCGSFIPLRPTLESKITRHPSLAECQHKTLFSYTSCVLLTWIPCRAKDLGQS